MNDSTSVQILRAVLPIVVIAAGVGGFVLLKNSRPEPDRQPPGENRVLVATQRVAAGHQEVHVEAAGQVIAAERLIVSSEVGGRIRWQNENLVPGGRLEAGARLLRIDARDYQLQVQARSADVRRAQLEVELEESRQVIAQREWETFGAESEGGDSSNALVLRQPQRETAEVSLRAAQSAAQQARLALNRTTVRVPFNAMVLTENIDRGQLVGPGANLATLVGTDAFWVQVSIEVEKLAAIQIPDRDGTGSRVRITQRMGDQEIVREGAVLRLLPDIDPAGAMARLLVSIEDPLGLHSTEANPLPMLLGSYVDVAIDAAPLDNVIAIPRSALREGSRVFVNDGGSLSVRDITPVWSEREHVFVAAQATDTEGLAHGEALITSRLPVAVPGTPLRTAEDPRPESAEQ